MILPTPEIHIRKLENLKSSTYKSLKQFYSDYEECFILFHPFEKAKHVSIDSNFSQNKFFITQLKDPLSWTEFLALSGIEDYKKLDWALRSMEGAVRYGDKAECDKLVKTLEKYSNIEPPDCDRFPIIQENRMLSFLKNMGYKSVIVSSMGSDRRLYNIDEHVNGRALRCDLKLETPDGKILVISHLDRFFSTILGPKSVLNKMIESLDLEGFFCDDFTTSDWSYYDIDPSNIFDVLKEQRGG